MTHSGFILGLALRFPSFPDHYVCSRETFPLNCHIMNNKALYFIKSVESNRQLVLQYPPYQYPYFFYGIYFISIQLSFVRFS